MDDDAVIIPIEAQQALRIARECFGGALVAAYLHGSAVAGGLRPDSDVDIMVIVDRPTTHIERKRLMTSLMKISGHPADGSGQRPIELIVFHRDDLAVSDYPPRSEFVYGEWLREAFEAGHVPQPVRDPELTVLLAQARLKAKTLAGPDAPELLRVIPEADLRRAIGDALPALLGSLHGDERNVLLALVRMWRTLTTGEIVPKDAAADWAISRLPREAAALVICARDGYLGTEKDDWSHRRQQVHGVAEDLSGRIVALL